MENVCFTFYNRLSRRYGDVFCYPTEEFAQARIAEMLKNPQSPINPSEVELCKIGTIDVDTGILSPLSAPVRLEMPHVAPSIDNVAHDVSQTVSN